jgi:hypothetical protein
MPFRPRFTARLRLAVAAATLAAVPASHAQDYPTRPITLVQPFPAGSPVDAMAREIGVDLRATLGQPVVVDTAPPEAGVEARWNALWGFQVSAVQRDAFGALMRKDAVRWSAAIQSARIKLE